MAQRKTVKQEAPVKKSKPKKEKVQWTISTAQDFIKRNSKTKGLKYWSASDYLKKVHGIDTEKK